MEPGTAAASFDVVIVGGGPAGSATALSLRAHAPELSVAIVEGGSHGTARIGETLPPVATELLEHLGVMPAFTEQHHRATHGTAAAWGDASLADNDFIYGARGCGWHLDRASFDTMLLREATRCGASVVCGARVRDVDATAANWRITLGNDTSLRARVVVDATGSAATIARRLGARHIVADRLAGFSCFYDGGSASEQRTLVEAFEDGWWYTAALPGHRRDVACMTDADIARRLALADCTQWTNTLAHTSHVAAAVRDALPQQQVIVRTARSRLLDTAAGSNWLAVGDAASSVDPLSSQGICRAMRSGIFGSYAIADLLLRGRADALERHAWFVRAEFTQYMTARRKYYGVEHRWPTSAFWQRRQCHNPQRHA